MIILIIYLTVKLSAFFSKGASKSNIPIKDIDSSFSANIWP
jgi:hypothetical protein